MLRIECDLKVVFAAISSVVAVVALFLTIRTNRQKKREMLLRSCNELCDAMSVSEIKTLLNNIYTICDNGMNDTSSIIEVQNELKKIVSGVEAKWKELQLQLKFNKQHEFHEKLEDVYHEYKSCVRDVETIVFAIGCHSVDEIRSSLLDDNSQEMLDIVSNIGNRYENDLQGFVKQIIILRFNELEIPDYASRIRKVLDTFDKDESPLYTRLRALMGSAEAQNAMGDYYYYQKQYNKAVFWYKKSAEQGHAKAQCYLGLCYVEGKGTEKKEEEAFTWFMKSSEQGFSEAQFNLGVCYKKGIGVETDEKEAFVWCKKSAELGNAVAQFHLGVCYDNGEGTKKDKMEAFKWFKKSAEQGNAMAQHNLGIYYQDGECTEKNEKEAFKWFKKSAEQGYALAQNNLGGCYLRGEGTEKNEKEGFKWYKKSAEQGCAIAQFNLGSCYKKGEGTEKDDVEAFIWCKKSAEQGYSIAQNILGSCYYHGMGCDQNYNKAFYWFNKACEDELNIDNYCRSINMIGVMYLNGQIGFGSAFVAVDYFKIAAQHGFAPTQYNLGVCYEHGIGVEKEDLEEAKYWYGEAAKQGYVDAIESLKRLEKSE